MKYIENTEGWIVKMVYDEGVSTNSVNFADTPIPITIRDFSRGLLIIKELYIALLGALQTQLYSK